MSLAIGQTLSHYEILSPVGAGGMGEVFRARDKRLEREVAIKVLPAKFVEDEERLARFKREAMSLAALSHPNVAQIFGLDQVDNIHFIAMEFVSGEDLATRLARGPLPLEEALKLCARVADGLEAAHELGVVHRDLKPANIVLAARDQPKLLDFGLAARIERPGSGSAAPDSSLTQSGVGLGSPGYMSPEQARGTSVDRRTDLFAFGCVLFECLCGKRAFAGDSPAESIAALLEHDPDWTLLPAQTPPRVIELLARCLEKDPDHRQRDAGDAALDLRAVLEGREWRARPEQKARPVRAIALGALVVAALVLGLWSILGKGDTAPTPQRTVRFDINLPVLSLAMSDRLLNELAVAPDGSSFVYVAEEGDQVGVYQHDLTSSSTVQLELGTNPRGALFSPDGRSLAFVENFRHLAVAPLEGGAARRIGSMESETGGTGAWLDDGRIVVTSARGLTLMAYRLDESEPTLLAKCSAPLLGFGNLASVPGASWFLASGWSGTTIEDYQVVAVDSDTGHFEKLIDHASNPYAVGGRYIVFLRGTSLMAVPFDFQARKLLGKPERVIEGISTEEWGGSGQFAVSPERTLVYAPGERRSTGRRIVWVSPDGSTEPILPGRDAYVGGIELSRDGQQLLLHTLRHKRELWSLDLNGGVLSPIDASGEPYGAVFSADGSMVFYHLIQPDSSAASTRQAPIGGGPSRLLLQGRIAPSSVTPDGKRLFLERQPELGSKTGADIMVLDLEQTGAKPVRFLDDSANDYGPRVSPDGEWLAYGSNRSGTNEVYLRSLESEEEWRVSNRGWSPRWAPDSKSLYYLNELRLMRVDLEVDDSIPTISLGPPREILRSLSFAEEEEFAVDANGRVAMVELAEWEEAGDRLRVVVGWLAELGKRFEKP